MMNLRPTDVETINGGFILKYKLFCLFLVSQSYAIVLEITRKNILSVAEPVYGEREARAIARLFTRRHHEPTPADLADLAAARPVQYILGVADFYDLELAVGEGVLVPRPETEELVRWILDDERGGGHGKADARFPRKILDVGTGSGAIAIALALNLPGAQVTGLDVSEDALRWAHRNNEKYSAGVDFVQGDILSLAENSSLFTLHSSLDLIVSNPPYIPASERAAMHDNVTKYEPENALFVPDDDTMLFYRAVAGFARHALAPGGALYFEIHENLSHEVATLLEAEGFGDVVVREDLNSKPRMVRCKLRTDADEG
jgi:release factor glutamine methyltransferase